MKKIIWIASYPKSGNTLIRAMLASFFYNKKRKFELEQLNFIRNYIEEDKFKILINSSKKVSNFKNLSFVSKCLVIYFKLLKNPLKII